MARALHLVVAAAPLVAVPLSHRLRPVLVGGLLLPLLLLAVGIAGAPPVLAGSTCEDLAGFPGDLDGDGFAGSTQGGADCDDGEAGLWSAPGAVSNLREITGQPSGPVTPFPHVFVWDPAQDPGSSGEITYDALRTGDAADFDGPTVLCLDPSGDDLEFTDADVPAAGAAFFYRVRARNTCGDGSLGAGFQGGAPLPRVGRTCDCSVLCDDGDVCTQDTCSNGACSTAVIDPAILRAPLPASSCGGGDVVFDVQAAGNGGLTYQWFKNGAPIGMNLPTLMLTGVSAADDGSAITVQVSDTCGNATSAPSVLTVFADPASCSGGLDGQLPPNRRTRNGTDDAFLLLNATPLRTPGFRTGGWGDLYHDFMTFGGEDNIIDDSIDEDDLIPGGGGGVDDIQDATIDDDDVSLAMGGAPAASAVSSLRSLPGTSYGGMMGIGHPRFATVAGIIDHESGYQTYFSSKSPKPTRVMALDSEHIMKANGIIGGDSLPTRRYAGEVLHHSGEYVYGVLDVVIRGRGFPFTFGRTYRSREVRNGRMGFQWVDNQDRRVEWENPATPVNLRLHDGSSARIDLYAPDGAGCYTSPGFFRHLCPDPSPAGGFILTFADKRKWFFHPLDGTPVEGKISRVEDRNGNTQLYSYDPGNGRLLTITDTLSRDISFGHDANGRITSVTDFTGRVWSYTYSAAGDLATCTTPAVTGTSTGNDFPSGKTTTYGYSENQPLAELNHNLQTVTDPSSETFVRVISSQAVSPADARFDRTAGVVLLEGEDKSDVAAYLYYAHVSQTPTLSNNFSISKTIVKDRVGNVSEKFFDAQNRCVLVRRYTGRAPDPDVPVGEVSNRPVNPLRPTDPQFFETRASYNADWLVTQVTHPNDSQVQVSYDSANVDVRLRGNVLQVTELPGPLGGAQGQIVRQWSYTTDFGTEYCNGLDGECAGLEPEETKTVLENGAGKAAQCGGTDGNVSGEAIRIRDRSVAGGGDPIIEWTFEKGWPCRYEGPRMSSGNGGVAFEAVEIAHEGLKMQGLAGGGGTGNHVGWSVLYADGSAPRSGPSVGGGIFDIGRTPEFPSTYTDPDGNLFSYTYDPAGNLQVVAAPPVTQPLGLPAQTVTWDWQYNAFGQVTQATSPAGRVDTVSYYTSGPQTGYPETLTADSGGFALTSTASYDAVGNVVSVTDARGAATTYEYNALDQVVRRVSRAPFLNEVYAYYDASNRLTRVDVRDDVSLTAQPQPYVSTLYAYDRLHRLQRARKERDEASQACVINEYDHDDNGRLAEVRLGEAVSGGQPGNTVSFLHDERSLLFQHVLAQGTPEQVTSQYDYDGNANVVRIAQGLEDPAGANETALIHDGYDRLVSAVDAEGNVLTLDHDAHSNVVSLRVDGELEEGVTGSNVRLAEGSCDHDELSRAIVCRSDHFDPVTGAPVGDGFDTRSHVFAPDARLEQFVDDSGDTTSYLYDSVRRLSRVTDPLGNQVDLQYDPNSNVTRVTHLELPTGASASSQSIDTDLEYDALDRLTAAEDHVGNRTTFDHDDRHNRVQMTDPLGNVVRCAYDGLGRRLSCERDLTDTGTGAGAVIDTLTRSVTYDDSHRVVSATDPNGHTTTYEYDSLSRLTRQPLPDLTQLVYQVYDAHHNLLQMTDASGTQVNRTYDRLNRLTGVTVLPGPGVVGTTFETYTYDGLGRPVTLTDDDTQVILTYDSHSNVVEESNQVDALTPLVSSGTFDNEGNLTLYSYPSGRSMAYTYDALNRVTSVDEPGRGTVATFEYLGPSRVSLMVSGNGVRNETDWDFLRRVTAARHVGPGVAAPILAHHTYQYDSMYNKTGRQDQLPSGELHSFSYDSAYRVVESERGVPPVVSSTITYTLDVTGNRTLVTGGGNPGVYFMDPAIPPADAQVHQYTDTPTGPRLYDDNGNLTSRTDAAGVRSLSYDYRNRLVQTTRPGSLVHEYAYDALGRRVARREGQQPQSLNLAARWTYYGCASSKCEPVQHQEGGLNEYVHALPGRGRLIQLRDGAGTEHYLHTDDLGSTVLITDVAGGVVERADYGDHGEPSIFDATGTPLAAPSTVNPYYFRGDRLDGETELYYCGTGVYADSVDGRTLGRRPGEPLEQYILRLAAPRSYGGRSPQMGNPPRRPPGSQAMITNVSQMPAGRP